MRLKCFFDLTIQFNETTYKCDDSITKSSISLWMTNAAMYYQTYVPLRDHIRGRRINVDNLVGSLLCLIIVIRFCSDGFFVHSTSNQESGAYFMEKRKPTNPIHSEIRSDHCVSACRVNANAKHTNSNHCPKCSIADFTSSGLEGRN